MNYDPRDPGNEPWSGGDDNAAIDRTYKIVRFHQDLDTPNETIVRGLTLAQAQAHCQRDDTHGEGWFDGYTEDES